MHRKIAAHSNMHRKIPRTCNAPLDAVLYIVCLNVGLFAAFLFAQVFMCAVLYILYLYTCTICIGRYCAQFASQDIRKNAAHIDMHRKIYTAHIQCSVGHGIYCV